MENEKTNTENGKAAEAEVFTLEHTEHVEDENCHFCGKRVETCGFDIVCGLAFVCEDCAKKKAPFLHRIWINAMTWKRSGNEFERGKQAAFQEVLNAIEESPLERVKRLCGKNGLQEDIPF